jgi:hypothetical protein
MLLSSWCCCCFLSCLRLVRLFHILTAPSTILPSLVIVSSPLAGLLLRLFDSMRIICTPQERACRDLDCLVHLFVFLGWNAMEYELNFDQEYIVSFEPSLKMAAGGAYPSNVPWSRMKYNVTSACRELAICDIAHSCSRRCEPYSCILWSVDRLFVWRRHGELQGLDPNRNDVQEAFLIDCTYLGQFFSFFQYKCE